MPSALITGVATGLGKDLACALARLGYHLTVVDVDKQGLEATAAEARQQSAAERGSTGAVQVACHALDVRDAERTAAVVAAHVQQYGSIDVAVLNAGIAESGELFDPSNKRWSATLEIDLTAVIVGTRAVAIQMLRQATGGSILAVASAGGIFPMLVSPVYAAAKAGVVHFTRSAAPLLRKRGVRLMAVCPEFVDTPLVRKVMEEQPDTAKLLLGSLDIQLLPPAAVTQLALELIADDKKHKGGTVALLRQDGSVQYPFARSHATARTSSSLPQPADAATWAAWATHSLPARYSKLQVHQLSTDFKAATRLVTSVMPSKPPPGCLLVRRVFAGINASDINFTAGRYHGRRQDALAKLPYDCGFETVNVVVAVGEGVTGIAPGHSVACLTQDGFSEYGLLPAAQALPVARPTAQNVALLTSGLTASIALAECGGPACGPGKVVLVTAAAGGTGQFAVQLAVRAGAHVVATAGGPHKVALVKQLGAHRVVDYKSESLKEVLKREYSKGVDLVYESVGGDMFNTCVDALAQNGRLIIIGMMSQYQEGWPATSHPGLTDKLLWKSASLHGFFLLRHVRLWRSHLAALSHLVEQGQLQVLLDPIQFVGLRQVPEAVQHLQSGTSIGKVVVQVCPDLPPGVAAVGASHTVGSSTPGAQQHSRL